MPAAIAAPTPVSALVHSSTLVTAGVFLLIRFYYCLVEVENFCFFIIFISIITTFMSGVCAIYEYDIKKIIALSTLRQLGVIIISLGMNIPMLALFHLYTHALFKALLFLCGGNIIHCYNGVQDIRDIKGVRYNLPFTGVIFNISNIALCGFPFLAGFYSKDLIIEILLSRNINLLIRLIGMFGVCLTIIYSIRISIVIIWGDVKRIVYENIRDDDMFVIYSILVLSFGALFGGFRLQVLVIKFNEVVILPVFYKLLVILLLFISLLISLRLWGDNQSKEKYNILY